MLGIFSVWWVCGTLYSSLRSRVITEHAWTLQQAVLKGDLYTIKQTERESDVKCQFMNQKLISASLWYYQVKVVNLQEVNLQVLLS